MNQVISPVHDPFPSLADLFLDEDGQLPRTSLERLESADRTQEAREGLLEAAKDLEWPGAWALIKGRVPELFEVSVLDLLLSGWEKYTLIADYAKKSREAPGKAHVVPLHKQSLTSEHHPSIDLLINEKLVERLDFTIKLKLDFAGARLTLESGEVRALETGECTGSGEVYLRNTRLYKQTFGKLDLPGVVRFGPGLTVPTREHPYPWGEGPAKVKPAATSALAGVSGSGRARIAWASVGALLLGLWIGSQLDQQAPQPPVASLPVVVSEPTPQEPVPREPVPPEPVASESTPSETVSTDAAPPEADVTEPVAAQSVTHRLTVETSPSDARVRIMNIKPVYSPGILLEPGRYHIRVEQPGYLSQDQWIAMGNRARTVTVVLQPEADKAEIEAEGYRVVVQTVPPGAEVSIRRGGRLEPFKSGSRLEPGNYLFSVRLNGYQPAIHYLRLENMDEEITVHLQKEFIH